MSEKRDEIRKLKKKINIYVLQIIKQNLDRDQTYSLDNQNQETLITQISI
jgi:hypothetical protein